MGHNCVFLPSKVGGQGKIVIVGGANPSGSFSDTHAINLGNIQISRHYVWLCINPVLFGENMRFRLDFRI